MARELTNLAHDLYRRIFQLVHDDRDVTSALDLLAVGHEYTMHDHAGLVLRKDQLEAWFEDIISSPEPFNWSFDVVAVRGEALCLARNHTRRSESGFGVDLLIVVEIDETALGIRGARFESEDLKAAHDCLNQWWIEGLSPELAEVASAGVKLLDIIDGDDPNHGATLLADDLVVTDNRRLSYGQTNKHGLVEVWTGLRDESPGSVMLQPTVGRLTPSGFVCTSEVIYPNGFTTTGVAVMIFQDGLFTHVEYFEAHDLDRALARFDELTTI